MSLIKWISHGVPLISGLVAATRSSANILSPLVIHISIRPRSGQPETSMVFCMAKILDQLPTVQTSTLAKLEAISSCQLPSSPISTFRKVQVVLEDLLCCLCARYKRVNGLIHNFLSTFPKHTCI